MQVCIDAEQLRAALKEIERAEANGFMHCLAVLQVVTVGFSLSDCRVRYSDLVERAHPTDGRFDWGRCQSVTTRNRFVNGKLVPLTTPTEEPTKEE